MRIAHGFFIPNQFNCINPKGLIEKVAAKVFNDHLCLFCEHEKNKSFKAFGDAQNHMKDMGHCMINIDYLGEFDQFYDFTADNMLFIEKYFDKVSENLEESTAEFKPKEELLERNYKVTNHEENEDWMDLEEQNDNDEMEEEIEDSETKNEEGNKTTNTYPFTKVKIGDQVLDLKPRYHFRNFMIENAQKTSIGELILPNKKLIGSKEFSLYYNQNYTSHLFFNTKQLLKILEDKGVVNKSDALVKYDYQDLKKMYIATINDEKLADIEKIRAEKKENEKYHKDKNFLKIKREMNSDGRHNNVLTRHFRDRNLLY